MGHSPSLALPMTDTLASNAGAAYVFRFDGSQWRFEQKLLAQDGHSGDGLGTSVAVDGDVIVAGAATDDAVALNSGSAYLYRFNPQLGQWVQEQKLVPDAVIASLFGWSVSLSGGLALIGARTEQPDGAAYFFEHEGGKWVRTQKLLHRSRLVSHSSASPCRSTATSP